MTYRYFIGISPPKDFARRISELQNNLYDADYMLRPLIPHITLLPPPALRTLIPKEFSRQIKKASKNLLPINLSLDQTGIFDSRVVFIKIECPELNKLEEELKRLLPEDAKTSLRAVYTPHLTLAQAKQYKSLPPELIYKFQTEAAELLPQHFSVSNLSSFIWQAPREYKIIKI